MNVQYPYWDLEDSYSEDLYKISRMKIAPDVKDFPIYVEGDVIDEEKSVRWNREEVTRRMQAREDEKFKLIGLRNKAFEQANENAINSIAQELLDRKLVRTEDMAYKKAKAIFNKADILSQGEITSFTIKIIHELVDFVELWRKIETEQEV